MLTSWPQERRQRGISPFTAWEVLMKSRPSAAGLHQSFPSFDQHIAFDQVSIVFGWAMHRENTASPPCCRELTLNPIVSK
jgi:hypothetical protein